MSVILNGETIDGETIVPKTHRGTTNRNARGSAADRAARRAWLVETYRADIDVLDGDTALPACRCYRCGALLTVLTVTVDRIIPGCKGGTYRRTNIRPACAQCNSETGGRLGNQRRWAA